MFIMKHLIYIFIIICLLSVIVSNNKKIEPTIITKTDTITLYDTITIEKPIPKYIKTKPDTVYIPSIDSNIVLDIETKVYKDSTYEAQISGFKPSLDYLRVFPKETIIYKEKVSKIKEKQRFTQGIQIGIGYNFINNEPNLYIGYGINVNLSK